MARTSNTRKSGGARRALTAVSGKIDRSQLSLKDQTRAASSLVKKAKARGKTLSDRPARPRPAG